MSLTILNNGLKIDNGIRYAWYHLQKGGAPFYRCVALKELAIMPVDAREEYDLLGKQWAAVRGLHNAGVNFVYAASGIYQPEHVGVVQYFGAAAESESKQAASQRALAGMATVEAVLANFPQSQLIPPTVEWFEWYLDFVTRKGEQIAAILGHPDPRQGHRGAGEDGAMPNDGDDDLAAEQNEILFRGLAKLRQNFVYQVLAEHRGRTSMTDALVRIAEVASNVASRRKGSIGFGFSLGIPLMAAINQGVSVGKGMGISEAFGQAEGLSHTVGTSETESWSHTESHSVSDGVAHSQGHSVAVGEAHTTSQSEMVSSGVSGAHSDSWQGNVGGSLDLAPAGLGGKFNSGYAWGERDSEGWSQGMAVTNGEAHTNSRVESWSEQTTISHAETQGISDAVGGAKSRSEQFGDSQMESQTHGISQASNLARMAGAGFSTGLLPGININRTWMTEDDVADRLTEVLRQLETLANQASAEGGFMTNAWLFTDTPAGAQAADALVPQAFHGTNVPTPVLTIHPKDADQAALRAHALAFTPWVDTDDGDPFGGLLWTRYATLLTAGQLAALTAPGLFEEGPASTVMAPIPPGIGFYPSMAGDVVLGHQFSPETADLTTAQVRISQDNLMHTMFAGDTGFGKSVAAIRMAYETTLRWKLRTVVLDFGAGWRSLLNAPGLEGQVEILQLWPDAVRPMRWNPLQIGRNIAPETQWRAFADVFGGIAQLGIKRQKQEMLEALRRVYLRAGVLIDDPDVRADVVWGKVQAGEESGIIHTPIGTPIANLTSPHRQQLAVLRSRGIGLGDLYQAVEEKLSAVPPRDTMLTGVLEGILFRLNPLVQGSAAVQFAPGQDTLPVEDLSKPWGVSIIEGGMFLDDFGKAFLLGWTGWHLYMDMVARRVHEVNTSEPLLQIVYEEANKIFVKDQAGEDESGGVSATQRFADMFRDARKYKARLHVVTQAPSLIASDIISSCNNLVLGFLKNPKDKDLVLSALARSEKGFHDEPWRRFVDDIPIGMAIGRFPYSTQREDQRAFLFRPLMLDVPEPTDAEIERVLGRIEL